MDDKRIREKWTDNCRGMWDDWVLFTQHDRNNNKSDGYMEQCYDRMPNFLLVLMLLWGVLVVRYFGKSVLLNIFNGDFGLTEEIMLGFVVGVFGALGVIYLNVQKMKFNRVLIISIAAFIVLWPASVFLPWLFEFFEGYCAEISYIITYRFMIENVVLYWLIRLVISALFIFVNHIKYSKLKEISNDIYTQREIKTYHLSQIIIVFVPIILALFSVINLVGYNFILSAIMLLFGYLACLVNMGIIIFKLKYNYRLPTMLSFNAYLWSLWSLNELVAGINVLMGL